MSTVEKQSLVTEEAVERLRAGKAREEGMTAAMGMQAGIRWVNESADYVGLVRLQEAHRQGTLMDDIALSDCPAETVFNVIDGDDETSEVDDWWMEHAGANNRADDREWLKQFVGGALEAFAEVESRL